MWRRSCNQIRGSPPPRHPGASRPLHQTRRTPDTSDRLRRSFDLRYQPTGLLIGRPALPSFVLRSRTDPTPRSQPGELRSATQVLPTRLWSQRGPVLAMAMAPMGAVTMIASTATDTTWVP